MKKIKVHFSGYLSYLATEKKGDINNLDTLKAMESASADLSTLHPKFNIKITEMESGYKGEEE